MQVQYEVPCVQVQNVQPIETQKTGNIQGHTVVDMSKFEIVPPTHVDGETQKKSGAGGIGCGCIAVVCIIAGGIMWGVCNDPNADGCNEAIKKAGQGLVYTGVGIIGATCCCVGAIFCCALGVTAATK